MITISIENNLQNNLQNIIDFYREKKNRKLIEKLNFLENKSKGLKKELQQKNKVIQEQQNLLNQFILPLEEATLNVEQLFEISNRLQINFYKLISCDFPAILIFNLLQKNNLIADLKSSRSLCSFAEEYGVIDNPFFMKRIARTIYKKQFKSYTTILFSLLGVIEIIFLLEKKKKETKII